MPARNRFLLVFFLTFAPLVGRAADLPADTDTIESLTPDQAQKLAKDFPGVEVNWDLSPGGSASHGLPLQGLKRLDAATARALGGYTKGPILLGGLTTLDADTARGFAGCVGVTLILSGLTTIDAPTAKALAELKTNWLSLSSLTTLDAGTASSLAQFKGESLFLDGLTSLDAEAVKALAAFKGRRLALNGLTTLDAGSAQALQAFKGESLGLAGLERFDSETAQTLAETENWDGLLPCITAFESRDSVAIAAALARRKGMLLLPKLRKISPKTLTALIEKEDVIFPLLEKLELIQEPDGSPTEDFAIPQWLEVRQVEQRLEEALLEEEQRLEEAQLEEAQRLKEPLDAELK